MSKKILNLENEVKSIKENESFSTKEFKCDKCSNKASSATVLKRHTSSKHKSDSFIPEVERASSMSESLQVSLPMEDRVEPPETTNFDSLLLVEDDIFTQAVEIKCEFWACKFKTKTTSEMTMHINVEHIVDESFIYPESNVETECPDCDKMFLEDHNFARHVYEEHFYDFTCDHCKKNFPGEDSLAGIHLKMCPVPCDGHPHCPCKLPALNL